MISKEEWERAVISVQAEMAQYVFPAVTPLSSAVDADRGVALATGNYLELNAKVYLLTCDHVIDRAQGRPIGHLPGPTDNYMVIPPRFQRVPRPIDLALVRLDGFPPGARRTAVFAGSLDQSFNPVDREVMFFLGMPGTTAGRRDAVTQENTRYSWFGTLESPGVPIATQLPLQVDLESLGYSPTIHVAVLYPNEALSADNALSAMLPNPMGMSGSLLWDTKFVSTTTEGRDWSPECARVCGVVRADAQRPELLIATRIEVVRGELLRLLREEAAYFRWLRRGRPLWKSVEDWTWAESLIKEL